MGLDRGLTFPQKGRQNTLSVVVQCSGAGPRCPLLTATCCEKGKSWEHFEVVQMRLGVLWAPPQGVTLGKSVHPWSLRLRWATLTMALLRGLKKVSTEHHDCHPGGRPRILLRAAT